ncbi:hypothetical protein [Micromonospora sp. NPDC047074]|uniref:hypothetical protein n=1 Tax=Micromonospora sp. NPDC047074 TaxID=3154339 RepID=UPI0033CDA270
MYTDEQVRGALGDLAKQVRPSQAPEVAVLRRARQRRRRQRVAAACAVVMVAALAATSTTRIVGAADGQLAAAPPDGPFLGWAPAGNAVSSGLTGTVTRIWNAAAADTVASAGPHTEARTLLATRTEPLGLVVIAQAYDSAGMPRIGFFTGGGDDGGGLVLRADRPAPDPATTKVVSLVSARLQGPIRTVSGDYWGAYAIVLAMPGVTSVQVSSTTVDQELRDGDGGRPGPVRVQSLPISSTALTTTITGFHRKTRVFRAAADGGAFGDAEPIAAQVVAAEPESLTVSVMDTSRVKPGQLAATGDGLVGQVSAVDTAARQVTIKASTAVGFTSPAYTDISNHPGQVAGDGTGLRLQNLPADANVNIGNRVLVPDPAQRDNRVGALTVGRVSGLSPVRLITTANLTTLRQVNIMVSTSR